MDFSKRFAYLRQGRTKKDYANFLGITPTVVSDLENGKIEPSRNIMRILLEKQNVNINWLLTGEGKPFLDDGKEQATADTAEVVQPEFPQAEGAQLWLEFGKAVEKVMEPKVEKLERHAEKTETRFEELDKRTDDLARRIARLESRAVGGSDEVREQEVEYGAETVELAVAENLAAGLPREAVETGETYKVSKHYLKSGERYCVARITGTSMTGIGIYDGCYVLLRYSDQAVAGKVCVVRYGDDTTLKKLENTKEGGWQLVYCDGSDTVIPLVAGDWEVLGEFVRVLK